METQKKTHFCVVLLARKIPAVHQLWSQLKEQNSTPILLVNFKVYVACQIVTHKCFLPFYLQQPETG